MSIVTLPCDFPGHRAVSFDILGVYSDRVFLADLCADWNGYASVTDAGDEVCHHCHARYGNIRVVCCDTVEWTWRELVHDHGAYRGIAPYDESLPLKIHAAWYFRNPSPG